MIYLLGCLLLTRLISGPSICDPLHAFTSISHVLVTVVLQWKVDALSIVNMMNLDTAIISIRQ